MTMATLWNDHKPQLLRKLVGYFENWETTLKALDTSQVFLNDKKLRWCQHSIPNLKKQYKPKAKNTLNKKSGNTGQIEEPEFSEEGKEILEE
ncbi:hypothetical protein RhiirA1_485120 [Rhizophagus irregularis]|uniref:Uncharacterized protein n=1 Tax=Rhizophagus irregularis TaxID=588596 RepID=A0A2N0QIJ7_9GLOM|nr:hypothetical protein RhiirA1_485120 [Rhizophagus irregularis]